MTTARPTSRPILALAGLLVVGLAAALPASARSTTAPTCLGVRATLVGTPGDDDLVGTDSRDVVVAGAGSDVVRGLGGNDLLCGGAGHDDVAGGAGGDVLDGGGGDDRLDGGPGSDTAAFGAAPAAVVASFTGGAASGWGRDALAGLEGLSGSRFDDILIGDGRANTLHGGPGHDRLSGEGGADTLLGEAGDDYMDGGSGADTLNGGTGANWCLHAERTRSCRT